MGTTAVIPLPAYPNGHNSSNSTACLSELESNQFTFISTVSHNIRDSSELLLIATTSLPPATAGGGSSI